MKWWDVKNAYSISGSKTCIISDIPPKGRTTASELANVKLTTLSGQSCGGY